jgi:two-component system chemotaxis response regulator CheY
MNCQQAHAPYLLSDDRKPVPLSEVPMKTCLVVDDSEVVRKVARRIFEHLKFESIEAESGQDALDYCAKAMPDAILLDSHIPPMATVDFLASLRTLPNGNKPVIIYCATDNDPTEIARALTAGADDYLLKPFDRDSLRAKLDATEVL